MKDAVQLTILDLGVADRFDCGACIWMKTYGFCYPRETLSRQYYYESGGGRCCSDYCTAFATK